MKPLSSSIESAKKAFDQTQRRVEALHKNCKSALENLIVAEEALRKSVADYEQALPLGREAALSSRRFKEEAEVDRDIARHALAAIEKQLSEDQEVSRHAHIALLAITAKYAIQEYEEKAARGLAIMTSSARALLRAGALAEIARAEAIAAGADEAVIPEVEAFRRVGDLQREDIAITRVSRWLHPRTRDPLSDEGQRRAIVADGKAFLPSDGGASQMPLDGPAEFDRIVYREQTRSRPVLSLVNALAVPGLRADDVPGWEAYEEMSPVEVLERLDALEAALPPNREDRRPELIELRRVVVDSTAR